MKRSLLILCNWFLLSLTLLGGVFVQTAKGQGTHVDSYPHQCTYVLNRGQEILINQAGTMVLRDIRRYHFFSVVEQRCADVPDALPPYPTIVQYQIIAKYQRNLKEATETVEIGNKKFTLTYSCDKDPWIEGGHCGPSSTQGTAPPAFISGATYKWGDQRNRMDRAMAELTAPGATFTSGALSAAIRAHLAALGGVMSPPDLQWAGITTPFLGQATEAQLRLNVKAQISDDADPKSNLVCHAHYCVIPNLEEKTPIKVIPTEHSGQWKQLLFGYKHGPTGHWDNFLIHVPAEVEKGAVVTKVQFFFQGSPDWRSQWSDMKFDYFDRKLGVWPSSTGSSSAALSNNELDRRSQQKALSGPGILTKPTLMLSKTAYAVNEQAVFQHKGAGMKDIRFEFQRQEGGRWVNATVPASSFVLGGPGSTSESTSRTFRFPSAGKWRVRPLVAEGRSGDWKAFEVIPSATADKKPSTGSKKIAPLSPR